jgi:hypothetical protein
MPVKRKLNKKVTKMPRNVKINPKRSKRASQKKRGRSGRGRKSQRGGTNHVVKPCYNSSALVYREKNSICYCDPDPEKGFPEKGVCTGQNSRCYFSRDGQLKECKA